MNHALLILIILPILLGGLFIIVLSAGVAVYLFRHFRQAWRFFFQIRAGYRQLRAFDRVVSVDSLSTDIRNLSNKAAEDTFVALKSGQRISYAEAERKSGLSLITAFALAVSLNNVARSPRYQTSFWPRVFSRRFFFYCFGQKLAVRITDVRNAFQRLSRRTSREIANLAMVGRSAGLGKLAAAERPSPSYVVPSEFNRPENPLFRLWAEADNPKAEIVKQQLDETATFAWLVLGQTSWFQDVRKPGPRTGRILSQLSLPKLVIDEGQRDSFIRHFRLPRNIQEQDFDQFIRKKVRLFRNTWGEDWAGDTDWFLQEIAAQRESVDKFVVSVFEALELVAIELSRRPTVADPAVLGLFNAALWKRYDLFMEEVHKAFKANFENANKLHEAYGTLLKVVMLASGRREVQGVKWMMDKEFSRWSLAFEKEQRSVTAEFDRILTQYPPGQEKSGADPAQGRLYRACLKPCRNSGCHANWDPDLLFAGPAEDALDLVVRVVLLACHRMKGAAKFDRVAGLATGGIGIAAVIALCLRKPLSILILDNLLNMVPQAAIAERLLLVDDAYQTGYSYQLLRSQSIGLRPLPPATNLFVLFKAKSRCDSLDIQSFGLTKAMEEARRAAGCALEYEYATAGANRNCLEEYGHYPVPVNDFTECVSDEAIAAVSRLLGRRVEASRDAVGTKEKIAIFKKCVKDIIARDEFIKTELLYDYPDLVLSVGWLIHQRAKSEGMFAYLAGSHKIIPFLVAANFHAVFDGCKRIPLIVSVNKGELAYHEILDQVAAETNRIGLVFADVSYRTGDTLKSVCTLLDDLNKARMPPYSLGKKAIILVDQWQTKPWRDSAIELGSSDSKAKSDKPERTSVELDVVFNFLDKLQPDADHESASVDVGRPPAGHSPSGSPRSGCG